jgi:ketosteroid isomerase-like protein
MRRLGWLSGAAVVVLAACQGHETAEQMQARRQQETDAFRQAVVGITRKWVGWMASGQADSIAAVFTDEGREMPPFQPAVVGRTAIRRYEAQNAAMFESKLTITSESVTANGPLGVDRGSYTYEGKAKKGAPKGVPASVRDEGKYLAYWENVNGQWHVVDLIWNPNRPMMPTSSGQHKPAATSTKAATPTKKPTGKKK